MVRKTALIALFVVLALGWWDASEARPRPRHSPARQTAAPSVRYTPPNHPGPLNYGELLDVVVQYSSYIPHDRFAPRFDDEQAVGRTFAFDVQVTPAENDEAFQWSYSASNQTLTMTTAPVEWEMVPFPTDPDRAGGMRGASGFSIRYLSRNRGRAVGTTAMGVRVPYDRYSDVGIMISDPEFERRTVSYSIAAVGAEARQLASHLVVHIEGQITTFPSQHAVFCGSYASEATLDNREEVTATYCAISVHITQLRFSSGSRIIGTWTAQPQTNPSGDSQFSRRPSQSTIQGYLPPLAYNANRGGDVILTCTVDQSRQLAGCTVMNENPPGYDLGAAAIQVTPLFLAHPDLVGQTVQVPISFAPPP